MPAAGILLEPLEPRLLLSGTWGTGEGPAAGDPTTVDNGSNQDTVVANRETEAAPTAAADGTVDLLGEAPALSLFGTAVPAAEGAVLSDSSAAPAETSEAAAAADSATQGADPQTHSELGQMKAH